MRKTKIIDLEVSSCLMCPFSSIGANEIACTRAEGVLGQTRVVAIKANLVAQITQIIRKFGLKLDDSIPRGYNAMNPPAWCHLPDFDDEEHSQRTRDAEKRLFDIKSVAEQMLPVLMHAAMPVIDRWKKLQGEPDSRDISFPLLNKLAIAVEKTKQELRYTTGPDAGRLVYEDQQGLEGDKGTPSPSKETQ